MVVIEFTAEEHAVGAPNADSIARAKKAILEDGLVLLKGVVSQESITTIREKMLADLPLWLARTDTPFNFNRANVQQDPPPQSEYLFRDVLFNEFAIAVTKSIFGAGMTCSMYSGNTALPNTTSKQPVHADMGHLWPNHEPATPPYALVVNLPVVDMGPWNGATEMWPGTHLDTSVALQDGDIKVSAEKLAATAAVRPPFQPKASAGDIIIRDMRMWHAGMPNPDDKARPMIAMIHWVGWFPGGKAAFPADTKDFFTHPDLRWEIDWTESDEDYTKRNGSYDLDPNAV